MSKLIHKLTYMNKQNAKNTNIILTPNNTLFILDWDDTLFPTSWTSKNNINVINNSQYVKYYHKLDMALSSFLLNIQKYGTIIIVTNAVTDWVHLSAKILPTSYNIIQNLQIESARSLYENKTNDISDWKKLTFKQVIKNEFSNKNIMNVISIGDAEYEHQALISLSQHNFHKIKYLKSFRLIREPSYHQIIQEIQLLNLYIPKIWNLRKQLCKTFIVKYN